MIEMSMEGEHLAAVCGLYCGACPTYRFKRDDTPERYQELRKSLAERWGVPEEEIECDGCLSNGKLTPYCRDCKMRLCAQEKEGVTRCADCPEFPCQLITNFNNDGVPHHGEVMKNIQRQKQIGVYEWLEEEYERLRCQFCGVSLDWYARTCHRCGTSNPYQSPSVLGNKQ